MRGIAINERGPAGVRGWGQPVPEGTIGSSAGSVVNVKTPDRRLGVMVVMVGMGLQTDHVLGS